MQFGKYLLFLPILIFIVSCSDSEMDTKIRSSEIWPLGTTYEIFVQSFADSNGDGIGDIPGMTKKLDYLQDLGIQAVWLMPIHPSPSYHKYDITDYYGIHPDYGSLEDFRHFVEEAHKRQIRVIMDMVVNHTSSDHPWFQESIQGPENPYRDYYIWESIDKIKDQIEKKEVSLDSDNISQWHPWDTNEQYYYGFFYKGMPDLNFDNPKVREEMRAIGEYWLKEYKVDGFRLDAAKHIYPDDRYEDCHAWWQEFGDAMREINPDVYLVGEVWGDAELVAPYMTGLKSMFNFKFFHLLNKTITEEKDSGLIDSLIQARVTYSRHQKNFIDALFVNNHDRNRLISELDGNVQKSQLALAILMTLPGMPYVYYGDEIGMHGLKPDEYIREPFLWDKEGNAPEQTYWIEPKNSSYNSVIPLKMQQMDDASIFAFYKYWIGERNARQVLREGDLESLNLSKDVIGFKRSQGDDYLYVIHNLSKKNISVNLKSFDINSVVGSFDKEVFLKDKSLKLPPYSSAILH